MLNIAVKVSSARDSKNGFTASGLGDRIHLCTVAWALSNHFNCRVNMHLSEDKWSGKKEKSFTEIVSLFPGNHFELTPHYVKFATDKEWANYLNKAKIEAQFFHYGDHLGWNEKKTGIDIAPILHSFPRLQIKDSSSIKVAFDFITTQWDTTDEGRRRSTKDVENILKKYEGIGLSAQKVGGESSSHLLKHSLQEIATQMSKAKFHVGVDSGFFHLAQLILPIDRIHIYNEVRNYWSHHLLRAMDKGLKVNFFEKNLSILDKSYVKYRYDSPRILKVYHRLHD